MSATTEKLELVVEGDKSIFVDLEDAQRELGIASGDTKEISTDALREEGAEVELPLMAIRPHQMLIIKASSGKLSCPGCVGGGRLLHGEVVGDGSEAHFKAHAWCNGAQGNGSAWIHHADGNGKRTKLCFGYLVTKG